MCEIMQLVAIYQIKVSKGAKIRNRYNQVPVEMKSAIKLSLVPAK